MSDRISLFKRLTRVFRSGPIVKSKIKAASSYVEAPASSFLDHFRSSNYLYSNAVASYGTYDRLSRYADYSEMEYTPELSSGLDIYSDEVCASDEHGRIVHIYSDNQRVRELLEHLFYDTLNIEFSMHSWIRNLVKYGDFFLFNDVHTHYGIVNTFPIPVNEIEREEGYDPEDPLAVRFRWVTQGNQILENWMVTHFRLLGNDNFLPYGSSVIEPARRIWRQLILIEDAMMVYRIIRSPERRVFYIDVGNIDPGDVPTYLEKVKTSLKRQSVINTSTGRVDLRYNPLSVDEDYFIPIRGDTSTKIETLAGGQFTGDIEDVEYIQKKLFAAIKIPRAYLGYDEDLSGKATLAQEDIRFSRTITRVQKIVISELNKLAMIHLAAHGFDGQDLINFRIALSNPSTAAQQQKLELWRARFEIASSAPDGMFSKRWIHKNLFLLDDKEIQSIKDELLAEREEELELEQVGQEEDLGGQPPAGGEEGGGEEDLNLSGIMGGEPKPEPGAQLEAGIEHEWDVITPSINRPESLEEIEDNLDKLNEKERPKGRMRRGRPHKSLSYGVDGTEMPDLNKHVDYTDNDPYDNDFMKNIGKVDKLMDEDDTGKLDKFFDSKITSIARINNQVESMLKNLNTSLGLSSLNAGPQILTEDLENVVTGLSDIINESQDIEIDIDDIEKDPASSDE